MTSVVFRSNKTGWVDWHDPSRVTVGKCDVQSRSSHSEQLRVVSCWAGELRFPKEPPTHSSMTSVRLLDQHLGKHDPEDLTLGVDLERLGGEAFTERVETCGTDQVGCAQPCHDIEDPVFE